MNGETRRERCCLVNQSPPARETREAVIIGRQDDDQITADDIAKWIGTIAYEVLCTIGPRVPRLSHEG